MNTYAVKISRNGQTLCSVKVRALDTETAKRSALAIAYAADCHTAAKVAASGGPAWAAKTPDSDEYLAETVRVIRRGR